MHDFGRVLWQSLSAVAILLGDQSEYLLELVEGRFARVHQCVAASERWNLSHPRAIVLAIEHDREVVKAHGLIIRPASRRRRWVAASITNDAAGTSDRIGPD